ncbi:MAG: hypothetical protein KDB07_05985, partial [Planctomycetes bacterium]|nr:hypothetical protein [Planctomycetota bacterium]
TLTRELKNNLSSATGMSAYQTLKRLRDEIDLGKLEYERDDLAKELADVKAGIEKRKNDPEYRETYEFLYADRAIAYRLQGAERVLELAKTLKSKVDAYVEAQEQFFADMHFDILAFESETTKLSTVIAYAENLVSGYSAMIEESSKGLVEEDMLTRLQAEQQVADIESKRRGQLKEFLARDAASINFNGRANDKIEFPWIGRTQSGEPISIKLRYQRIDETSIRDLKAKRGDWAWIADVSQAKSFFISVSEGTGSLSSIIDREGMGLYLFRIVGRTPDKRYAMNEPAKLLNEKTAQEQVREFAVQRIMRELALNELKRIRAEALASNDAKAFLASLPANDKFAHGDLGWFEIYQPLDLKLELVPEPARNDGSKAQTLTQGASSTTAYFDVLTKITSVAPITAPFFEAKLGGYDDRELQNQRYTLSWLAGHKKNPNATPSRQEDLSASPSPYIIEQIRKAQDPKIIELLSPTKLLESVSVKYDPFYYRENDEKDKDEDQ